MPKKNNKDIMLDGLDIEKWIEKPDSTELVEDSNLLKYEKKFVAFLDLLGITQEIRDKINGTENEIISKMSKIKDVVESEIKFAPMSDKMDMLYISDSFIFVCEEEAGEHFLKALSSIQIRILVECKTLLRGALEYGDVIIRDYGKQIIGPAYIDAYLRQEHDAIYPRIIMGNSVLKIINRYDKKIALLDDEVFLDYIGVELEKKNNNEVINRLMREGIFDYLYTEHKKYDEENKLSIRTKYAWTINYLKEKGVWPNVK